MKDVFWNHDRWMDQWIVGGDGFEVLSPLLCISRFGVSSATN